MTKLIFMIVMTLIAWICFLIAGKWQGFCYALGLLNGMSLWETIRDLVEKDHVVHGGG